MKKLLVFLLAFTMILSFAACGKDDTISSDNSNVSKTTSTSNTSKTNSKTNSTSSKTNSTTSTASGVVSATSDTTSTPGSTSGNTGLPEFTNKYVSFQSTDITKAISVNERATDATSIRLTKINEAPVYGDVVLFTSAFGTTIATGSIDYTDYAILVCTYNKAKFTYTKTSLKGAVADAEKGNTNIPEDGFVIAIHKDQKDQIAHLSGISDDSLFFVHGIQVADISISAKKGTPVIDGNITTAEYGAAKWEVNDQNLLWDYSQFEVGNYEETADIYTTYDNENLYLGVVVNIPSHYCPLASDKAGSMYSYTCIQVNVSAEDPLGSYISEHFDNIIDKAATDENVVRQYGFAVNDSGETISCVWMPASQTYTGNAKCVRDANAQKTYYEVAIPWKELGSEAHPFSISDTKKIGLSVSLNSTSEAEYKAGKWKNLKLRNGGGIIGRNDFSKMASVTLG